MNHCEVKGSQILRTVILNIVMIAGTYQLKYLKYITKKEGPENLTLTGHIGGKRAGEVQWVTYFAILCYWMAEQGQTGLVRGQK